MEFQNHPYNDLPVELKGKILTHLPGPDLLQQLLEPDLDYSLPQIIAESSMKRFRVEQLFYLYLWRIMLSVEAPDDNPELTAKIFNQLREKLQRFATSPLRRNLELGPFTAHYHLIRNLYADGDPTDGEIDEFVRLFLHRRRTIEEFCELVARFDDKKRAVRSETITPGATTYLSHLLFWLAVDFITDSHSVNITGDLVRMRWEDFSQHLENTFDIHARKLLNDTISLNGVLLLKFRDLIHGCDQYSLPRIYEALISSASRRSYIEPEYYASFTLSRGLDHALLLLKEDDRAIRHLKKWAPAQIYPWRHIWSLYRPDLALGTSVFDIDAGHPAHAPINASFVPQQSYRQHDY
ncbi:hypothetical protein ABW19_dt0205435 [Dactylella cylindrospora]|nr:hypothetical protein ABW19_dt0205435 [Dactylella cylindrospora]